MHGSGSSCVPQIKAEKTSDLPVPTDSEDTPAAGGEGNNEERVYLGREDQKVGDENEISGS